MRRAEYFTQLKNGAVECVLCPHNCRIAEGNTGLCGARKAQGGVLWAESWGAVSALALDPVEKKPLRRFHPGKMVLSVGSYGCNLHCPFCQNYEIAAQKPSCRSITPQELAALSLKSTAQGSVGVAYTYNEPLVGYEFVRDCAELVAAQGQKNILVTNGFINEEPLTELLPLIHAMNIDLKAFSTAYYKELGGALSVVKRAITLSAAACHVEVTALIVPGKNDAPEEMEALAAWLAEINTEIPLHVSRFFPRYKMLGAEPTSVEHVYALAEVAKKHLHHVYTGNC